MNTSGAGPVRHHHGGAAAGADPPGQHRGVRERPARRRSRGCGSGPCPAGARRRASRTRTRPPPARTRPPTRDRPAGAASPGSRAGRPPGPARAAASRPAGPAGGRDRRQLPDLRRRPHRLLAQLGPRPDLGRRGQPGRGLAQPAQLGLAGLAVRQVLLEAGPVVVGDRVHRVGARQRVRVDPAAAPASGPAVAFGHHSTPRQSRSLISPSRIRVFTVPTATPSSPATSR